MTKTFRQKFYIAIYRTTLNGVFAGGDVVHQPATVVLAMKEAKKVVAGIASYVDAVKLLGYKREDIQN